ncbi:MAG: hypothetical protein AAF399_10790 [Bacteroidota bacterium]
MYARTNLEQSPWIIIQANRKTTARIEAIEYILKTIPYETQEKEVGELVG